MTNVAGISDEDHSKIRRLRELVKPHLTPYYDTDFNLLRWTQGHNNQSMEEIASKLIHHLQLRKCYWGVEELHKGKRTHPIHNHWKYGITGNSEILDNVIVNVEQCGRMDYNGMMETHSISEVMRARLEDLEVMLAQVMELERKTGKQAWILYVMDVSGLEYNKKLYDLVTGSMRALAEFMAEHYVEMIKFFAPVCVPNFAYALYTVVRPLLPEKTRDKVRLIPESHWRDEIQKYSKPESLPVGWSDDSHSFNAKIDTPTKFPVDKFYSELKLQIPSKAKQVSVTAGKVHVWKKYLEEGTKLRFWVTGNRGFGVGCFFSENEIIENYHVAEQVTPTFAGMPGPTLVPFEDQIIARKNGFYHVWVSNERSWWFSLSVHLLVETD